MNVGIGKPHINFGLKKVPKKVVASQSQDSSDSDDSHKVIHCPSNINQVTNYYLLQTTWPSFSLSHLSPSGKTFGLSLRKKGRKGANFDFKFNPVPIGGTASLQPPSLPDISFHLHRDGTIGIRF